MHAPYTLLPLAALAAFQAQAQERPNILYIMCDDMGYGDLGCYGQQLIATPHIDRLASEGMRFTQAYAGSPVSAPSRACFMTGQHTGHTHVRGNKEYWRGKQQANLYGNNTDYPEGVIGQEPYAKDHKILPEILRQNGYTTGMFGKWAGGYEGSHSVPETRGIDEFYGYICQFQAHSYYTNFLNKFSRSAGDTRTRRVVLEENIKFGMPGSADYLNRPQYTADLIHQEAMAWLDKQEKGKPFLGIFTYTLPHAELAQPNDSILQAYAGKFCEEKSFAGNAPSWYHKVDNAHAQFAAMITRLDIQVGQIMEKLKAKGLDDNTIVIFTSDNGPHEEGGADPSFFNRDGLLKGTKRSTHEGGIRIPFIVRWPGKVRAGMVNDHQLAFYDLLPTFCDIAQIKDFPAAYQSHAKDHYDGISFYPTLIGQEKEQKRHEFLYWEFHETDMMGLRMGDWKLVVKKGQVELYDLSTDLHEDKNVAKSHPEVVRQMVKILKREHIESPIFKVTLPQ
ncbi:MAG: arylsulfatase [Bacteroidales bacterium]|nr:arylsulfatase [Bacteroidales bacterium]